MTREEQINILTEARDRALKQIDLTEGHEMGTEEFQRLIYCAEQLRWMAQCHEDSVVPEPEQYDEPEVVLPKVHSERVGNLIVSEVVQPAPKPEPETPAEPEPEKPETGDDEEPAFKMEEVRAALAKARGRGVNVSEIIRSFGVNSFPEIPKNKYGAIMAKLAEV